MAFVAWEEGFDGVTFLANDPFGLGEGAFGDAFTRFEEVAIDVAGINPGGDFGEDFNVGGDDEVDVHELQRVETDERGVIFDHSKGVFEVRWTCTRKG